MKRIFVLILALAVLFSLCACGKEKEDPSLKGLSDAQKAFAGDWYGWWQIKDSSEGQADLEGAWYDCCASVNFGEDGPTMVLWDVNVPIDDPLGVFKLNISEGGDCSVASGWLNIDGGEIGEPSDAAGVKINLAQDLMSFTGKYTDSHGSFTYVFTMRPWGNRWEGIDEAELPLCFDSWYLPLIDAGASSAPGEIYVGG